MTNSRRVSSSLAALFAVAFSLAALLFSVSEVSAFEEPNDLEGDGCTYCHPHASFPDMDCQSCHGDEDDGVGPDNGYEQGIFSGPHGGYTTGTAKCSNCHTVHDAVDASVFLLPASTIVGTCFTCHDGTGGSGVYGVIEARTGTAALGGHSYEATGAIPGGDGTSGGTAVRVFRGPGGTLICTDCHSPHASEIVEPFTGDRRRIRYSHPSITSTRLLRQTPTGASTSTAVYGSDWCLACHEGRASGGMVMNHPVDSDMTHADPFVYSNVAILASEDPTSVTTTGTLGGLLGTGIIHNWPVDTDPSGNRGFLMPEPRTAEQAGHSPICQQCHEDSRYVGDLSADGSVGDAATATVAAADGVQWDAGSTTWTASWASDNPPFQNFPHETMNSRMLVEEYDDLCLNCHPVAALP